MNLEEVPDSRGLAVAIKDLDLRERLSPSTVEEVGKLLEQVPLLVFRSQVLSVAEQVDFARNFGVPVGADLEGEPDPETCISYVSNRPVGGRQAYLPEGAMDFHVDWCYRQRPSKSTILYCIEPPPVGTGETTFADSRGAYEDVPRVLRDEIHGLAAVHAYHASAPTSRAALDTALTERPFDAWFYPHPIVIEHPATSQPLLYVNQLMTQRLVGVASRQSDARLTELLSHFSADHNQYAHAWQRGDLLIWDNYRLQHGRRPFSATQPRVLRRISLYGDAVPVRARRAHRRPSLTQARPRAQEAQPEPRALAAPAFILTSPGSGSTLLLAMIGAHPDLFSFPEMHLLASESVRDLLPQPLTSAHEQYVRSGLVRAVAQILFGGQDSVAVLAAQEWLEAWHDSSPLCLFDELRRRVHPRLAVEGSPGTPATADRIGALVDAYPGAKFIHLVRDPGETIASVLKLMRSDHASAESAAQDWYHQHAVATHVGERVGEARYLLVRAEQLRADARPTVKRIAAFLDVSESSTNVTAMLAPESWLFAYFGPAEARGGGDPEFLARPAEYADRIAPAARSAPNRHQRPPVALTDAGDWEALARRLGYS